MASVEVSVSAFDRFCILALCVGIGWNVGEGNYGLGAFLAGGLLWMNIEASVNK